MHLLCSKSTTSEFTNAILPASCTPENSFVGRGVQTTPRVYLHAADHDLTGQILWPAATLLANYIAAHPSILKACSCAVELGAGLGLVGLLAAQRCFVVLTDHNDVVLRVLQRNAKLNQAQHDIRS